MKNPKELTYTRGKNAALDTQFENAVPYGKVKLAPDHIFWKSGLRWYAVPLSRVCRAYRQVEYVIGRLCCGGSNFDIQRLVLVLDDETSLELVIGDNQIGDHMKRQSEALFQALQNAHPHIRYENA